LEVDRVICHGTLYLEITKLAEERGVDLIVIAQVGHRGLPCILVGSVTERAQVRVLPGAGGQVKV
jgi:nucleotide-binding universal stress UspA family protein